MARYIDAEAVTDYMLERYNDLCEKHGDYDHYTTGYGDAIDVIENAPAADVVPKSEVERLKAELDWIQARHPFAMTLFELEACEKHAAIKAVKEVWRELRSKCDAPHWCVWLSEIDDYFEKKTGVKTEDIAEFKKKYTEEKG